MTEALQWHLYVVECIDGTLYCGITTDVSRRIQEHNHSKRGAKYTRSRRPVRLIYTELHLDRSSASKAESSFKRLTRQQKINKIRVADESDT